MVKIGFLLVRIVFALKFIFLSEDSRKQMKEGKGIRKSLMKHGDALCVGMRQIYRFIIYLLFLLFNLLDLLIITSIKQDIVIGTPGRLKDLIEMGVCLLKDVSFVVSTSFLFYFHFL